MNQKIFLSTPSHNAFENVVCKMSAILFPLNVLSGTSVSYEYVQLSVIDEYLEKVSYDWKPSGFYTKGRPLVKSNLICPSDKLSWQPDCPVSNINIQGNFCIRNRTTCQKT